jgi:hypothetical protein
VLVDLARLLELQEVPGVFEGYDARTWSEIVSRVRG